ncbi:MAG: T9SS type A sorting domain-containing protein, partial [Candidatus Krumholzibacteria bacterium]|nr:T9SS type A sorting domain-containing protein [Candidatus Krumholzibacteria bacterium]
DIFRVKFNPYGAHLWSMSFGSTGGDQGVDVAVDNAGSIFVTGYFEDIVEFGGGALVSNGGRDIFVVKFSFDGTHMWSRSYGSSFGNDEGHGIAVDGAGNVIVGGEFGNTVNYGGFHLTSNGDSDIFLAKYDTFGTLDWAQSFGGLGWDSMEEVAAAASNNDIYLTGHFPNSIDLGGGALVSAGSEDIFLARYSPGGGHQWSKRFGDSAFDYGIGLAVDAAGNVTVTGSFMGTVNFGGGNFMAGGATTGFVASYTSGGNHRWSRMVGQSSGWDVATSNTDDVFVAGHLLGTADFGGGELTAVADTDVFIAWYDMDGNHKWSNRYGDSGNNAGFGIAVDLNGHPTITGETNGSVDFGGGSLGGAGGYDVFVAKFFGEIEIGALDDCANDRGKCALMVFVKHFLDGPPIPFNPPGPPVTRYSIWRAVGTLPMYPPDPIHSCPGPASASLAGTRSAASVPCDGWEKVADIPATAPEAPYMVPVPTTRDATPGDPAIHYFVVLAEDDQGGWHTSPPESISTTNDLGSAILAIEDVPNDNGRLVSITFARDSEDAGGAATPVLSYGIYRRDDPPPSISSPSTIAAKEPDPVHRIEGWTYVASAPAHGDPVYAVEAPTVGDSTISSGDYSSTFFVRAMTAAPTVFFDSPWYAGYSLDNLAPPMPTSFAYNAGTLSWDPSTAGDFGYFTVYGNAIADFTTAVVVDYTTAATMDVSLSPYAWYYVTATDFSGNEGPHASIATATGIAGTPNGYVLSVTNHPNPFNPSTAVKYTVPTTGAVNVSIYDARGSRIATLVDNPAHAAGAYSAEWNGRNDAGSTVSSGVYFARITHSAGTRSRKLVLLK